MDSASDDWLDALDRYEPIEPDEPDEPDEPIEQWTPLISATNPPASVTVSTYLNGAVARVDLVPGVVAHSEAELAEEIRIVADVAAKKATSAMYVFGVELLAAGGVDRDAATGFLREYTGYATPAQARSAEAALAARHTDLDD